MGYFKKIDKSFCHSTWIEIPKTDGSFLHAQIYRDKNAENKSRPYIIAAHGMNCSVEAIEWFSIPLVRAGYHVLAFNQNGHGLKPHRSPGNRRIYPEIMVGVHDVVNWVLTQPDVLCDMFQKPILGFVGHSTGGLMALSQAYLNPHIKVTIALSQIHDFMEVATRKAPIYSPSSLFRIGLQLTGVKIDYTDDENRIISPKYCLKPDPKNNERVFMIHAADDVLPIEDAYKNRDLAQLPAKNCLFLQKGSHGFRAQETVVVSQIVSWFRDYL
jgi:hypothetical protein